MHAECFQYVSQFATNDPIEIIEIGSLDINGSSRCLFPGATSYIGLDLQEGPGVDWIGDAATYQPDLPVDLVICTEVLEHAANWRELIRVGASWLKTDGRMLITCAGYGRRKHSHHRDRRPLADGEHYANLTPDEVADALRSSGLSLIDCEQCGNDIQATAVMATFEPRQKRRAEIAEQYRHEPQ